MKSSHRVLLVFLSIITLGIYPLVVFNKNKKGAKTTKTRVDVEALIKALGGSANISGVEYVNRKLKVFVHNKAEVKMEEIKNFKQFSNLFISAKYVSFFVSDSAKALAEQIVSKAAPH